MAILRKGRIVRIGERKYKVQRELGKGGSGAVYLVTEGRAEYALKLFYPYYQLEIFGSTRLTDKASDLINLQRQEYEHLSKIRHSNILRVYGAEDVELHESERKNMEIRGITKLPALLAEFVEGLPLLEAIKTYKLNVDDLGRILRHLAEALQYLHEEKRYMHGDIKSENIMIRSVNLEPVLIDFALCKNLNFAEVSAGDQTRLIGDWDLFPKDFDTDHRLKRIKEKRGTRQEIFDLAFPALDLFQFGKLLHRLKKEAEDLFEYRERSYIGELATQLTDWELARKWSVTDLLPRISRLSPGHFTAFGVPELTSPTGTERTIMVPPGVGVPVTKRVERVIGSLSWRRLCMINQLCLLSLVYPGADYKRSAHVLFSYDLTRQLVTHLYAAPLFRMLVGKVEAQQLLLVSLLHDINHFPFLHIFQESQIPDLDKLEIIDLFCDGEATGERQAGSPSLYELLGEVGIEPRRFKRLLFSPHHEQESEVDAVIKSVIDSGVDIDKLSYLFLDGYFTGVRYGAGIDYPCILKAATIGRAHDSRLPHLGFTDRALQALENVVLTRFWNFRSLYWHHTNRAFMAMLLRVVGKIYIEGGRDVKEYLLDTLWMNDIEALKYINGRFRAQFGRDSIVKDLPQNRGRLFKRIYTVRAGMGEGAEDEMYRYFKELSFDQEREFCRMLGEALEGLVPGGRINLDEDEILVDVPRRVMDEGGIVRLSLGGQRLVPLTELSEPVRSINSNYERLTKRVRVFVSPRVAGRLSKKWRVENREEIRKVITEALEGASSRGQMR